MRQNKTKAFLIQLLFVFCFMQTAFYSLAETGDNLASLKKIADSLRQADRLDSALAVYQQGAEKAHEAGETATYSAFAYNVALIFYQKGKYGEALNWAEHSYGADKQSADKKAMAASANLLAAIYEKQAKLEDALRNLIVSIELSEQLRDSLQIAIGSVSLGNIHQKLNKNHKALEYYKQASEVFEVLHQNDSLNRDFLQGLAASYYEMGRASRNLKEYSVAEEYFKKALSIRQQLGGRSEMAIIYNELGSLAILQGNHEQSLPYFGMALRFKMLIGDQQGMALVYANFSTVYLQQSKLASGAMKAPKLLSSENFAEKSLNLAIKLNDKNLLHKNYSLLYQIEQLKGDFKKALHYHERYMAYHDTLFNDQRLKIIEEASQKYEAERKEKENLILQHENNIQSLAIKRQKTVIMFSFASALLILLVFIVLYVSYRNKKKKNRIISEQNSQLTDKNMQITEQNSKIIHQSKLIEEKNKDLTDSINYAQKIQEAMMSDSHKLAELFDDAFILLKPKDIVSGDFYWIGQEGGRLIVGAIDCTGHGVPGAFMSMLGDSYLNHVVHVEKRTDPAEILEKLSWHIKKALNQEETRNQDGMDMSLCSVDLQNKRLEWAGAKNPLVMVKNGEAVKIKADSRPIGGSSYGDAPFTKHVFYVEEPTSFYMFSDGYQDQFGGPKNKKFMVKRMQKLFMEIADKPMHEQKEILLAEFDQWKGDAEQIDDVVVVGFSMK